MFTKPKACDLLLTGLVRNGREINEGKENAAPNADFVLLT